MAQGTWTMTDAGVAKLFDGTFDIDSDSFKIALVTAASNIGSASTTWAGVTGEVANGNGYTTGGEAVTVGLTAGRSPAFTLSDTTWTATGGNITAKYAVIYEVGGNVLAYSALSLTGGNPQEVTVFDGNDLNANGTNDIAHVTVTP